jgi:hypothetical protein
MQGARTLHGMTLGVGFWRRYCSFRKFFYTTAIYFPAHCGFAIVHALNRPVTSGSLYRVHIEHAHGQIGSVVHRRRGDIHEIF